MSFKKIMHEVTKQGLDEKVPYTPKQLSEQGYMSPAFTSSDMAVEQDYNFAVESLSKAIDEDIVTSMSAHIESAKPKEKKKDKEKEKEKKKSKPAVKKAAKSTKPVTKKEEVSEEVKAEIKEEVSLYTDVT